MQRVTRGYYQDEDGRVLWETRAAEYVPPGTLVTSAEGVRYLAVRVEATPVLGGLPEAVRVTLRRLQT